LKCAPLSRLANWQATYAGFNNKFGLDRLSRLWRGRASLLAGWHTNANFKARICAYDIKTDSDSEVRRRSEPIIRR
jgi:hypothetical protein